MFIKVEGVATIKAPTKDLALMVFHDNSKRFLGGAYKNIRVLNIKAV
jgi:hypothetical protein